MISTDIAARLRKGAGVLGKIWRRGERCASGWAAGCADDTPSMAAFCEAKGRWVTMAAGFRREGFGNSEFAVVEAMTASEFEASGLTMTIEHPTHGRMKVGPRGSISLRDLPVLSTAQDAVPGTIKILETFPGAVIEGTTEPE